MKLNKLIEGVRGQPAGNRQTLIDIMVNLSAMADAIKDQISEIDINPLIVTENSAIAVDGLIVGKH